MFLSNFFHYFNFLTKRNNKNIKTNNYICHPMCAGCETEVSEKTAKAIYKLIESRIKEINSKKEISTIDTNIVLELMFQQQSIKNGTWHTYYDQLENRKGE